MNRAVLISLGVLVAIAAIVLVVLLGKSEGDQSHATMPGATSSSGDAPAAPGSLSRQAPTLPGGGPVVATGGDPNHPTDYAVGDIHVRDHRAGDHPPLDIPPNVHSAEGRALPPAITTPVTGKVLDVLKRCVVDFPKDARGDKPRLEGQIDISIKSGKTTINKSTVVLRNVSDGPAADALKTCVEQKSIGIQNDAPDQEDLDSYTINLSYAIP